MTILKITEHFFFAFYSLLLFLLFLFSFTSKIANLELRQPSSTCIQNRTLYQNHKRAGVLKMEYLSYLHGILRTVLFNSVI